MHKLIDTGMSILDLSKVIMANFHYNYMLPKFGENQKLLITDTDILIYDVKTEDFYTDIAEDVDEWFDTSKYSPDHKSGIHSKYNDTVPGFMTDETKGPFN